MISPLFERNSIMLANALLGWILLVPSADNAWVDLLPQGSLDAFTKPSKDWIWTDAVSLDGPKQNKLKANSASGPILANGPKGTLPDLLTKQSWKDHEIHLEFLIPKGSNSGIKMHGHYEIQIMDTFGKKDLTGDTCGGVYPRAELKPIYRHIDKGIAPLKNACKAPGEWQTLDIQFRAPRFDPEGKKVENARLLRALLNGELIHDNVELKTPTGHNYVKKEMAQGPILLQADHGAVAFRGLKVKELK
ncbi:MAG: DUF1080 domain-containing protein [Gemmataceae bacterium]|nr:DUF1080 domain-containing protein [Gemmataceae bacterium]